MAWPSSKIKTIVVLVLHYLKVICIKIDIVSIKMHMLSVFIMAYLCFHKYIYIQRCM